MWELVLKLSVREYKNINMEVKVMAQDLSYLVMECFIIIVLLIVLIIKKH